MPSGVLIDTSFLITLADPRRQNHAAAVQYWKHFKESGIPIYLSVIVVSEFEVKQTIPEDILRACIPVIFNWSDAIQTAKFDRYREKVKDEDRTVVKDDMKLIAQAVVKDVAFAITDDHQTFAKYSKKLRDDSKVKFTTLVLRDGFDAGHFRKGGPDLLTKQGF